MKRTARQTAGRVARGRRAAFFGYDATRTHQQRRNPPSHLRSEDDELPPEKRRKLVARARDARRNMAIARWAINKHLDHVSTFTFRSATGVKDFDAAVNAFMAEWAKPENCDVTGRFSLRRLVRMIEGHRLVDGDLLVVTLADGRLQLVEGDKVRDPLGAADFDRASFVHGVKLGPYGRHVAYAVHRRKAAGFEFERMVSAANAVLHGYFDRNDQVRGVSPAAPALNALRDTHENFDYALARAKLSQIYGLVTKRKPEDALPNPGEAAEDGLEHPGEEDAYEWDPDDGPIKIALETGEEAELLESRTPSGEFREFNIAMVGVALKALDLPYSFYDESFTNFFGSKSAKQLYLQSAEPKREDNRELLDRLTRWRLMLAVLDGRLDPAKYGLTLADMRWKWTPKGSPWLDAANEVRGDLMAVHAGFTDYAAVIEARTGEQFEEVIDRLSYQRAYMREKGVAVEAPQNLFGPPPVSAATDPGAG